MKGYQALLWGAVVVLGAAVGMAVARQQQGARMQIQDWPEASRTAAQAMIEKYGEPTASTSELLLWTETGEFTRTVVFREPVRHEFPMPHEDVLLQTVPHRVPADKVDELVRFDGSLIVDRTAGEISARCDTEAANRLALNLAHEIIQGGKDVEEARRFYAETLAASMAGRESEYTRQLRFGPMPDAPDPDKAMLEKGGRK